MNKVEFGDNQALSMPEAPLLEFSSGNDGAQKWIDDFLRRALKMKHSQSRAELISILKTGKHNQIEWADEDSITAQQPELTQAQIAAIVAAQDKRCANELINVEAARIAVNAFIHSMMGKTSMEILMADPTFRENDAGDQDPTVSWRQIMATHVLEREGPGVQKTLMAIYLFICAFNN